jgi:hypothetical protein
VYQAPADADGVEASGVEAQGILVMGHTRELLDSPVDTVYYVDIQPLLVAWDAELAEM